MSLKKRLISLFVMTLLALTAVQAGLGVWRSERNVQRLNQTLKDNLSRHWDSILEFDSKAMKAEQRTLNRNSALGRAVRDQDTGEILENIKPTVNRLTTLGIIDDLSLYNPRGQLLYASNREQEQGSAVTQAAMQAQEVKVGTILNAQDSAILQVSFPLYLRGKLVGGIRLERQIAHPLRELSKRTSAASVFVLVDGTRVAQAGEIAEDWNPPSALLSTEEIYTTQVNQRHKVLIKLPVLDEHNQTIAYVISVKDEHNAYLEDRLNERIILGTTLLVMVVVIALIARTLRSALSPLETAIQTLKDIGAGDLETQTWRGQWRGEFQDLMSELGKMQAQLAESDRNQRRLHVEENNRNITALDNVSNAVMVADETASIIYLNPAAKRLMRSYEEVVVARQPSFSAADLTGRHFDLFSDIHGQGGAFSEDFLDTKVIEIEIDNKVLKMVINPVHDPQGRRVGTVTEWQDLTAERQVINEVENVVAEAKRGNLTQRIELADKHGFFLNLSRITNDMVGITAAVIEETARIFSALAHGDLTQKMNGTYTGAFEQLKVDANGTVFKLREVLSEILKSAEQIRIAAENIKSGNHNLSERTESAASSLQDTSSDMSEMSQTIGNTKENAYRTNQLAQSTRAMAQKGRLTVSDAVSAMQDIDHASSEIGNIVGLIDDLSFKINLLAVNAAVEAAHAGEQGRGFAVVATEVRDLAVRSAEAASDIKRLIEDSVSKVGVGTALVNTSGNTLSEIVSAIEELSDLVQDMSHSTTEQSVGIDRMAEAVGILDKTTQQNAILVEELGQASQVSSAHANRLSQVASFFNVSDYCADSATVGRR